MSAHEEQTRTVLARFETPPNSSVLTRRKIPETHADQGPRQDSTDQLSRPYLPSVSQAE